MNCFNIFLSCLFLSISLLSGTEFTIGSYNCGGLSDHYDYLRAASMEKLMQERHIVEPEYMSLNEKIQKIALKILFSNDPVEKNLAKEEWDQKNYDKHFEFLTEAPTNVNSINKSWNNKAERMITSYQVRPVTIYDEKVNQMIDEHLSDLNRMSDRNRQEQIQEARKMMAMRIFANHFNYDILCLQEADYLDSSMFPETYEVLFTERERSKNGIAWNKERFELVNPIGDILGRAFAVQLLDMETGKIVLIASGHITGCNPYRIEKKLGTGKSDSAKGDNEIQTIIDLFNNQEADLMIIGMDSNVTSLHPRLNILKDAGYKIDYENYLEPTCTNPYQVLNTRIDWICLKSNLDNASIVNIPVLSIGLNNIKTNISDHKPIAAKINY